MGAVSHVDPVEADFPILPWAPGHQRQPAPTGIALVNHSLIRRGFHSLAMNHGVAGAARAQLPKRSGSGNPRMNATSRMYDGGKKPL